MTDIVTPVIHLPGRAHLLSVGLQNGDYNIPRAILALAGAHLYRWVQHLEHSSLDVQM